MRSRFLKINSSHLEYVFGCIDRNTTKAGNIKAYLLAALYNAPVCADQNPGYKVFDADGKVVYEPQAAEPEVKVSFLVKVSIKDLNVRKGPGTCMTGFSSAQSGFIRL